MRNQNVLRAIFVIAVSLAFGLGSLRYSVGTFAEAGPGLFPLLISMLLLIMGLVSLLRARFVEAVPMVFAARGFIIILMSFFGFAAISQLVNMIAGIVFMVFCASFAGSSFSWIRNLKIALGLVVIAFLMKKVLGIDLPLY